MKPDNQTIDLERMDVTFYSHVIKGYAKMIHFAKWGGSCSRN